MTLAQAKLLRTARRHATGGMVLAFLKKLVWKQGERHQDLVKRYRTVQAQAQKAGVLDELILAERKMWENLAKRKRGQK